MSHTVTTAPDRNQLLREYREVRAATLALCEPLAAEDMVVQSMPEVSPTKWHLAHVTWFFETLVLTEFLDGYEPFDPRFHELFNSYYQSLGEPHPRGSRGLLTRPTVDRVLAYRRHVDAAMIRLLEAVNDETLTVVAPLLAVGVNHEQQHQELMLMDILHVFAQNPLCPAYAASDLAGMAAGRSGSSQWHRFAGGEVTIGADDKDFAYDNERPQHELQLPPFELCSGLVTNGDYRAFMADGGYQRPELWLADGWDLARREQWQAPLYWERRDDDWSHMTLRGRHAVDPDAAVSHVSYYEADAFARWADARLPTECEWEHAAASAAAGKLDDMSGVVWQWTASPYTAYPGFVPYAGALGEYNGKFMLNQLVLRGSCHATPAGHQRLTYRNFYHPHQRWQFAGLRLARS